MWLNYHNSVAFVFYHPNGWETRAKYLHISRAAGSGNSAKFVSPYRGFLLGRKTMIVPMAIATMNRMPFHMDGC